MLRKILLVVVVAAIAVSFIGGCKKKEPQPPNPPEVKEPTKTMADYEAQAQKEITKENMAAEMSKLEKEIDADAAAAGEM